MSLSLVMCVVRTLRLADLSSRGILLSVSVCVCHGEWSDSIVILCTCNEKAE